MKATKKDLAGLTPDEWDRKNIVTLIERYNEAYPYPHPESLGAAIEDGLREVDQSRKLKYGKKKDGMQHTLKLPMAFVMKLKQAYPTIFSDKTQYDWFIRNFPGFDLRK